MKTRFLLIFIVMLFCGKAAYAQGITYEKAFGGVTSEEDQSDLKEMKSGGYMVAGATANFGAGNYDAYCIRLDKKGNMLWSKTYGTPSSEFATKCWGTSDSGFLISFCSRRTGTKDSGVFLIKCNMSGSIQWSKFIRSPKVLFIGPAYIYESKNGDYYLLYNLETNTFYPSHFTLLKLSAKGKLIWEQSVDAQPPQSYSYYSARISESDEGDIIVTGSTYGDGYNSLGGNSNLFLFSPATGRIKQSKKIYVDDGGYSTVYIFNFVLNNNKISATGYYADYQGYENYCWFSAKPNDAQVKAKYIADDSYHSIQYMINKHFIVQPEEGFSTDLLFTKDGGYIRAYRYFTKISNNYDIIVDKFDSLGRICRKFETPNIDTTVRETTLDISDKSYSSIRSSVTITDSLLTVTDITAQNTFCEGTAPLTTDKIENTSSIIANKINETKLQLYPNPANDFVNINFDVNKAATIQFNIINTEGKIVLTKQLFAPIGKQQTTFTIQTLPPGAYYIKIIGLNKPTAIQFLKTK